MASDRPVTIETFQQLPTSKHFRLERLADGVYAAIHIDGGSAISNAGIVDLGGRTLVFDAFFTPQAAEDLRAAAEEITGRPVDAVIDSHYHNDHIWGNQAFGQDTDIISTAVTRRLIAARGMDDYASLEDDAEANLESTRAQYRAAQDDSQRRQLSVLIDYYQGFIEAQPTLKVRLPNLTFVERLVLHGADRSAELIPYVGGHNESDTVLFLPKEGIAFMGDLLFVGHHPWLGDGDPDELLRILEAVSELDPKTLVPGHGPVGTLDDLKLMCQYIGALDELARRMVEDGEAEEKIDQLAIPEPFDDWLLSTFFAPNVHFLYQRQSSKQTGISV